jgi:Zn-dependent peptidase ImmA (M78 family)
MATEVSQRIQADSLMAALRKRDLSLASLAKDLGESPSTFHRWVQEKHSLPRNLAFEIISRLKFDEEETSSLLMLPKYRSFFRRRYLGKVPAQTHENAIELAKTFLNLSTFHSEAKFRPTDLSGESDAEVVAEHIRRYFALTYPSSLRQMFTKLRESGVEVGFVRFTDICTDASVDEEAKEDAFSVTDQNRFSIFCNTESVNIGKLPFVIAHELAHLFRSNVKIDKAEEQFCNLVASEIIHPRSYFLGKQKVISRTFESSDQHSIVEMIDQIVEDLGGEFWGVAIRLQQLGLLPSRHKYLLAMGRERSSRLEKIESLYFDGLRAGGVENLRKFWDDSNLASHPVYHYYSTIKRGIQAERMTPRAFSRLFKVSLAVAENLSRIWRSQFQQELELQNG